MIDQTIDLTLKPKCPVCQGDNITRELLPVQAPWHCQGCGFECFDVEAFLDLIGKETNAKGKQKN